MRFSSNTLLVGGLVSGMLISSMLLAQSTMTYHAARVDARLGPQEKLTDVDRLTHEVSLLNAEMDQTLLAEQHLEAALPQEDELPRIAAELGKLAEANSLQAQPALSKRGVAIEPLREQILQMNLTGDFNGFYAFVLQLEQLPYPVQIRSMKLQPLGSRDGELQADLVLSLCFRMTGAKAAATIAPGATRSTEPSAY